MIELMPQLTTINFSTKKNYITHQLYSFKNYLLFLKLILGQYNINTGTSTIKDYKCWYYLIMKVQ